MRPPHRCPEQIVTRHPKGQRGSLPRAEVMARKSVQVKLTEAELQRYKAESHAAGDADLSATVRRLMELAIAVRASRADSMEGAP